MAYDPGYAAMGIHAPILVQAKPSWARPGSATAAAVIAFIVAGFSLLSSVWQLSMSRFSYGLFGDSAQLLLFGLTNLTVALAFIAGGAGLLGRQAWGRVALIAGAAVDLLYNVYQLGEFFTRDARFSAGNPISVIFLALDVAILVCVLVPSTSHFLATRNPMMPVPMRRF